MSLKIDKCYNCGIKINEFSIDECVVQCWTTSNIDGKRIYLFQSRMCDNCFYSFARAARESFGNAFNISNNLQEVRQNELRIAVEKINRFEASGLLTRIKAALKGKLK